MTNSVFVKADENGGVIRVSANNPEFGWVILAQEVASFSNNWLKLNTRSVRQMGKVADLEKVGYKANQKLNGQIVINESITAFNENDPERDLKIAGTTGVVCTVNGEPIYRQVEYTMDMKRVDVLIDHDNGDEIRSAWAAQQSNNKNITPSIESLVEADENVFEI
jgi:hypothetical protein